jgi:hypothetical protein
MDLTIKLQLHRSKPIYTTICEVECCISIDQGETSLPSETMLDPIFHHLYQAVIERLKTINAKAA